MQNVSFDTFDPALTRYITLRQSHVDVPRSRRRPQLEEEEQGLISEGTGDVAIEMGVLPPRWLDMQDEVMEHLDLIASKSNELDRMHQKHVLPGFDDEAVKRQEETRIEAVTEQITRSFRECRNAIQRIEKLFDQQRRTRGASPQEEVMARNVRIALAAKVQEASAAFRKKQSLYLRKMQSLGGISAPIGPSTQNPYTDPSMAETADDRQFSQSMLRKTTVRRGANDTIISQRENEINDIAKGIIELADIFTELQSMVIDQGTVLDRIDYNIENMATNVKEADKELNVATNYQRKYTKRKIIFLLFLLIVGLVVLLLVKPKRGHAGANDATAAAPGLAKPMPEGSLPDVDIARPKPP